MSQVHKNNQVVRRVYVNIAAGGKIPQEESAPIRRSQGNISF